jgi:hypothetical protein
MRMATSRWTAFGLIAAVMPRSERMPSPERLRILA